MENSSEIMVYVAPDPKRVGETSGRRKAERFADRVHDLGQNLGNIANDLRKQLDETLQDDDRNGWGLDEVKLSFSLDLQAEAGVVMAKATTAAGFEASLTWVRRDGEG